MEGSRESRRRRLSPRFQVESVSVHRRGPRSATQPSLLGPARNWCWSRHLGAWATTSKYCRLTARHTFRILRMEQAGGQLDLPQVLHRCTNYWSRPRSTTLRVCKGCPIKARVYTGRSTLTLHHYRRGSMCDFVCAVDTFVHSDHDRTVEVGMTVLGARRACNCCASP